MRKFKSILCLALALVMIFALCACTGGKTEPKEEEKQEYTEKYNIVYATTDPANSLLDTMLITPLKEDLAAFSNNRIELEVYYSGSLAGQGGVLHSLHDLRRLLHHEQAGMDRPGEPDLPAGNGAALRGMVPEA